MNKILVKDKENLKNEIIRFVITGVIAAIVDFAFYSLTTFILKKAGMEAKSIWMTVISTIIGSIFGITLNYFLSVYWVFQNVDETKQNEHKKLKTLYFFVLSVIGLLISIGIMALCKFIFNKTLNVNIDTWWDIKFEGFFKWLGTVLSSLTFWLYAISFILKTLGGLIFNYISRKKLLFKKPENK